MTIWNADPTLGPVKTSCLYISYFVSFCEPRLHILLSFLYTHIGVSLYCQRNKIPAWIKQLISSEVNRNTLYQCHTCWNGFLRKSRFVFLYNRLISPKQKSSFSEIRRSLFLLSIVEKSSGRVVQCFCVTILKIIVQI